MINWTLLLCEGAHDQKALAAFARVCSGWKQKEGTPDSLPPEIRPTYPNPRPDAFGTWRFEWAPDYLIKDNRYLAVRNLGGVGNVLGKAAIDFLEQIHPSALGIFVDANDVGVEARAKAFVQRYGTLYKHASKAEPGRVSEGNPRLGLWVAPDNKKNGALDDVLVSAAARTKKKLLATGKRFATSLARIEAGEWTRHRNKAILGAINQVVSPGASLAVSINTTSGWFDATLADVPPFKQLLQFLETLTAPLPATTTHEKGVV